MRKKGFLQGKGQPVRSPGSRLLAELKPKRSDEALFLRDPEIRIGAEFEFFLPGVHQLLTQGKNSPGWGQYVEDMVKEFIIPLKEQSLAIHAHIKQKEDGPSDWTFSLVEAYYIPFLSPDRLFYVTRYFLTSEEEVLSELSRVSAEAGKFISSFVAGSPEKVQAAITLSEGPEGGATSESRAVFRISHAFMARILTSTPILAQEKEGGHSAIFPESAEFVKVVEKFSSVNTLVAEENPNYIESVLQNFTARGNIDDATLEKAAEYAQQKFRRPLRISRLFPKGKGLPPYAPPPPGVASPGSWEVALNGDSWRGGVKVISPPLPPNQFLQSLPLVLDYVKEYGFTDRSCGLHIGIFAPGLSTLNILKFLVLLEETAVLSSVPDWAASTAIQQLSTVLYRGVSMAVRKMRYFSETPGPFFSKRWIHFLEQLFSAYFSQLQTEDFGVNFSKSFSRGGLPYIEFRYFGGSGYEEKGPAVWRAILYYLKALRAALSRNPEGDAEYHRGLYKIVTRMFPRGEGFSEGPPNEPGGKAFRA